MDFLAQLPVKTQVSVATEYGEKLVSDCPNVSVEVNRLNQSQMVQRLMREKYDYVIDTTHPFAERVTAQLKTACQITSTPYLRVLRPQSEDWEQAVYFSSTKAVVDYLQTTIGNVLLTTGSKTLKDFVALADYRERLFVRVLPMLSSLAACEAIGLTGKHIIAMQGPFSALMNEAQLEYCGAKYLVTKDSGETGGLSEKLAAAKKLSVQALVIKRPIEEGYYLEDIKTLLESVCAKGGE